MEKITTVKTFDVYDKTLGRAIIENLKTFEDAEAYIIVHDNKMRGDWQIECYQKREHNEDFKHHEYLIYHFVGKVTLDDVLTKMSFAELCDEAFGWRAISVVEFKF